MKHLKLPELISFFSTAEIPNTLNGDDRFYDNPSRSIDIWITSAENSPEDTDEHERSVNLLNILAHDLEDRSNWNVDRNAVFFDTSQNL